MKPRTIIGIFLWVALSVALGYMGIDAVNDPLKFLAIIMIVGGIYINGRMSGRPRPEVDSSD